MIMVSMKVPYNPGNVQRREALDENVLAAVG